MGDFPDVEGCNWCLEVRQAARVQTDEHECDLAVLHKAFSGWLGPARIGFADRELVALAAASELEVRRFEQEANRLIAEHDLFLLTSLYRRSGVGAKWERVAQPQTPITDEQIEAELATFVQPEGDERSR